MTSSFLGADDSIMIMLKKGAFLSLKYETRDGCNLLQDNWWRWATGYRCRENKMAMSCSLLKLDNG